MKTKLLFITMAVLLAFAGCKKDEETDPRDKFIGTWNGYSTLSFPELGISNEVSTAYFKIEKGAYDEQLKITDLDTDEVFTAKVTGNTYTYDTYIVTDYSAGYLIEWQQEGYGSIDSKHINEYFTVFYTVDQTIFTGTLSRSLEKQ